MTGAARVVRPLDQGVVPVPALVAQQHAGQGADRPPSRGARGRGPGRDDPVDGDHRHPPGPGRLQRRVELPRPRRGVRAQEGTKRVLGVDVTGLPLGPLVVPASAHENRTTELKLGHLARQGVTGRLELVLTDRGVTATAAQNLSRAHGLEVRRAGWTTSSRCSVPSGTPGGSGSPTAGSAGLVPWPSPSRTPPRRPPAARRLHRAHPAASARPHRRAWSGPHPATSRAARPLSGMSGRRTAGKRQEGEGAGSLSAVVVQDLLGERQRADSITRQVSSC